ncbi:MotA/TolQ/ExbB proton channel family protein [Patulibacter americanus]|uniref:MotA/TolQ/ExbB proton channel family protein n=1 Tax=Patulibacter americanus TaxID=588672 RepID=UPI0003B61754|nr:MotA/TolQ/ExbB proton channel family protein [Patulibacter americanus]
MSPLLLADIESDVIFRVADALRVPVLVLTLLALLWLLWECGAFAVELVRRRRRDFRRLDAAAAGVRESLVAGRDRGVVASEVQAVAWSGEMGRTLDFMVREVGTPGDEQRLSKALADFDFGSLRRLERTRLLVRAGPALGLMGTLIPLSPALAGLARGDVQTLTENLRVAFSVTVLGLLIGAVAFGISLVRDRLYGQDLSDLEYLAAAVTRKADGA